MNTATAELDPTTTRADTQPLKPQPGMPMAWRTKNTSWTKKMKKKKKKPKKLNELSLRKALYIGRYQQTKERVVKKEQPEHRQPKA